MALLDKLKVSDLNSDAGLSIAEDMAVPASKAIAKAEGAVQRIDEMYRSGLITEGERRHKIIDEWTVTMTVTDMVKMENNGVGHPSDV